MIYLPRPFKLALKTSILISSLYLLLVRTIFSLKYIQFIYKICQLNITIIQQEYSALKGSTLKIQYSKK